MPLDRTAALRNAEKLLRQGKLEPAIAEYLRIVEDQPRDLNSTNTLGDLYVRAGQVDKAVEQYIRIASILHDDGFLPKAGALYKKILKLKPDHEHALVQAAEIAANQGLLADARMYFKSVADRRHARGDARGVAQAKIRLGTLDPADYPARMAAAAARVEIGEQAEAVADLKAIAAELSENGRQPDAIEALRRAALISPDDDEIREGLLGVYMGAGDFARARECAVTAAQFKSLAAALEANGRPEDALGMLREAARLDPADAELRERLAKAFVANGNLEAASEYLTAETAGSDPLLQLMAAELQLRGNADEGMALVRRLLEQDPARRDDVAGLGWKLADELPDVAFKVVELAAETAVVQTDWASAAAALQEYVTRVPHHIAALMRLVEICVDGGLEATMYEAQAQLADAYIAAGMGPEARFIAEDLVAREPWERANIERFRRSLVLLGETDPDGVIAERLSGQTPFMSTDVITRAAFPALDDSAPPADGRAAEHETAGIFEDDPLDLASLTGLDGPAQPVAAAQPPMQQPAPEPRVESPHFELSTTAIDMDGLFADTETPPAAKPKAHAAQESVEVDLSIVLGDIGGMGDAEAQPRSSGHAPPEPLRDGDLDSVFEQLRDEASKLSAGDGGEEHLKRGMSLRQAGMIDESIQAFEMAARSPRHRFQAATLIGRSHRGRGHLPEAIEWFDRAAQAPAPTEDEGHMLMYELADALESVGEVARALAICIELQASAPEFRDVAARVDRLSKVQTQG